MPSLTERIKQFKENNIEAELIYLEADNDILTKRYSETRRKHPFSNEDMPLHDAIENEHNLLTPLVEAADLKIDTSHTTVHDLRKLISQRVVGRGFNDLSIQLISFGYKHGTPRDADYVFDVRCLPNPYWSVELRGLTGLDNEVIGFLDADQTFQAMYEDIVGFLDRWIPRFEEAHRGYLTVAIGCTGGQHRSVHMAEKLAFELRKNHEPVLTRHNNISHRRLHPD